MDQENPTSDASLRVGRAAKLLRNLQELTRRDLAKAAGISYSYLSEIENGTKRASAKAQFALAKALGVSVSELLGEAERLADEDQSAEASSLGDLVEAASSRDEELGARARQRGWYEQRRKPISSSLARRRSRESAEYWTEEDVINELRALIRMMDPEDRARLVELAERLAS